MDKTCICGYLLVTLDKSNNKTPPMIEIKTIIGGVLIN